MLTIHAGANGAAVLVEGDRIAALAPLAALREAHPRARVRQWPGTVGPGLAHSGPLPDAPSPRERVHALLRRGVTAITDLPADPALREALKRAAVARNRTRLAPGERADLAVIDASGECVATVLAGRLVHRRA
jgi:predicted amidohydrolase YtcJ